EPPDPGCENIGTIDGIGTRTAAVYGNIMKGPEARTDMRSPIFAENATYTKCFIASFLTTYFLSQKCRYLFTAWIGCCLLPILEKLECVLTLVEARETGDLPAYFEKATFDLFVVD